MAETLIERIAAQISPELIQKASAALGEPEAGVTKGFQTAIPAILAKFAEKAETAEGATELLSMVNEVSGDGSAIEDPSALLDMNLDNPAQDRGQALLGTLFGRQAPEIVSGLAEDAGVQPVSMGRLMSVVSPLLLGELGQKFGGNATAEGLSELVTAQKPGILGALPATLAGVLGLGALSGLAGGLKDRASDALGAVTGAGAGAVEKVGDVASGAVDAAKNLTGDALGTVTGAAGVAGDALKNVAGAAGGAILGAGAVAAGLATGAVEKVGDVAGDTVDAAKSLAGDALGAVTGAAGSVGDGLKSVAGVAAGAVTGAAGKVGDVAGEAVDTVKNLAGGAVDKAGDALGATGDAVKNVAGAVGGAVLGAGAAAAGLASGAADKVGDVAGDAVDAAKNVAGAATGAVKNVAGAAGDVAGKTFDTASDAVESVAGGLPKWVVPAVALAVLALLGGYFLRARTAPKTPDASAGQTTSADATPDPGAATPEATPDAAASPEASPDAEATPAPDANGMTDVKVGDLTLKAAPDGIEDQLIAFLNDPSKQVDKTTWFNFDRLLFDTGKATLKPESKLQLQNVAEILKGFPRVSVKIGGYTDNTGNKAANKKLSTDRAGSVVKSLVALGIAKTRLASEGYGDQYPVASNDTAEGREQNRRIAIRVTKK